VFDSGLPSGTGCKSVVVRVPSLIFDGNGFPLMSERTIRGVMKNNISLLCRDIAFLLKREPIIGILERPGVLNTSSPSASSKAPPIIVVPPSGTTTLVLVLWVFIPGVPPTAIVVLSVLFSATISKITVPTSVICGVTCKRRGTDTN
jgi:hypothetical protein